MKSKIKVFDNCERYRKMWDELESRVSVQPALGTIRSADFFTHLMRSIHDEYKTYHVYVSSSQVLKILGESMGVKRDHLHYARRKGHLVPAGRKGKSYFYLLDDVKRWAKNRLERRNKNKEKTRIENKLLFDNREKKDVSVK